MSLFRRWCEVIRWRHELFFDVGGENKKVVLKVLTAKIKSKRNERKTDKK